MLRSVPKASSDDSGIKLVHLHAGCVLESQLKVLALGDAVVQLTDLAALGYSVRGTRSVSQVDYQQDGNQLLS